MKTAVTVLQEMMVKLEQVPKYEEHSQIGPQHVPTFEYRCKVLGHSTLAQAPSKKEAKQEAARAMLLELARSGMPVPPPYGLDIPTHSGRCTAPQEATTAASAGRQFVTLLKELVEEYRLPAADYELVGDSGPPHMRQFTMSARIGKHVRQATSTTKKAARQLAAEQLYKYLRENLKATKDFVEEDALTRAHEKVMERYVELRGSDKVWRPDLSQKIADYHLGLVTNVGEETLALVRDALSGCGNGERALAAVAPTLGLSVTYEEVETYREPLVVVRLGNTCPELAFAARDRDAAATEALEYINMSLNEETPR